MTMHLKTCVGAHIYVSHVNGERVIKGRVECLKEVKYRLEECEEGIKTEFYCCSDHVQHYRDENERANREVFWITKL